MSEGDLGILDTRTVVLLPRLPAGTPLPARPLITSITLAELTVGPLVAADDAIRAARLAQVQQAEADFDPLPFDAQAARAFGSIAATFRRSRTKRAARAFDALIAAIAVANRLPLYTCNPEDFAGIEGLEVVAIPHPDRVAPTKEVAHGDRS